MHCRWIFFSKWLFAPQRGRQLKYFPCSPCSNQPIKYLLIKPGAFMITSYFSMKVWTGKKQGMKTMPESLLRTSVIATLDLSVDYSHQCHKFRKDNTDSKWYQVMRSPSHKLPSVTCKIMVGPTPAMRVRLVQGTGRPTCGRATCLHCSTTDPHLTCLVTDCACLCQPGPYPRAVRQKYYGKKWSTLMGYYPMSTPPTLYLA